MRFNDFLLVKNSMCHIHKAKNQMTAAGNTVLDLERVNGGGWWRTNKKTEKQVVGSNVLQLPYQEGIS